MAAKTILIVDDEEVVRQLCKRILEEDKYELVFAESVQEASEKIKSLHVDLLIVDMKLSDGDGIEVISKFRQKFSDTQIFIITGSFTPEDVLEQAAKFKVSHVLPKPFNITDLKMAVERALG
ncbi:response regulator [Elusimicrobiota bacterium]